MASPAEVVALVEAITARYRAAVVLAAWCGLRRGEDGRDAEIASALAELAAHGDAAKLPRSIVVRH